MKKSSLLLFILMAVGLVGCIPNEQAAPTTASTSISTATTQAKSVPTLALTIPTQSTFLPEPGCTVVSRKPTPGPTEETIFPPISNLDHVQGPDNARVTIIEYSDFQ